MGTQVTAPEPSDIAILRQLADDKPYKTVAHALNLTQKHVETRARRMREAYNLGSTMGLVALALRRGWIE